MNTIKSLILPTVFVLCFIVGCEDKTDTPGAEQYDGVWSGTTTQDSVFAFTVEDGEIVQYTVAYYIETDSCLTSGSVTLGVPRIDPITINDDSFTFTDTSWTFGQDGEFYTVGGTFNSSSNASGTLDATWISCGSVNITWGATKQ